jgi:hypothetical protein
MNTKSEFRYGNHSRKIFWAEERIECIDKIVYAIFFSPEILKEGYKLRWTNYALLNRIQGLMPNEIS